MRHFAILAIIGIAALPGAGANAQAISSCVTQGLTQVSASKSGDTWTFILKNLSNSDANTNWDVLAWSLEPYNIQPALSTTQPSGWDYKGSGWDQYVVNSSQKYYTPPALAPGQSLTFTWTVDPNGALINPAPGENLRFASHVGAVKQDSGNLTGTKKWEGTSVSFGNTWHDCSIVNEPQTPPVPEPASMVLSGLGLLGLASSRRRR